MPYFLPASFEVSATNTSAVGLDSPSIEFSGSASPGAVGGVTMTSVEAGWSCDGLTCTSDEVAPGATVYFTVEVDGTAIAASPDQDLTLGAVVSWSNGADSAPGEASASATASLGDPVLFELTGQSPATVVNGDEVTWTWTLSNVSNTSLWFAELGVAFDPHVVTSWSWVPPPAPWDCYTSVPYCGRIAPTAAGDSVTFDVTGTVDTTDPHVVLVAVLSYTVAGSDLHLSVEAPAITPIGAQAALSVEASLDGGATRRPAGSPVSFDVEVTNTGPSPAASPAYRFALPPGMTLEAITLPDGTRVSASSLRAGAPAGVSPAWSCSGSTEGSWSCASGDQPYGIVHRFRVDTVIDPSTRAGSVLGFEASVDTITVDPDHSDNTARVEVTVGSATSGTLPRTGVDAGRIALLIGLAVLLVAAGVALQVLPRRRTTDTP